MENLTLYDPGHVQKMETMVVWLLFINKSLGHSWVAPKPLFQNEAKCKAIDMKMNFYSQQIKNHFYEIGLTLSLVLKNGSSWNSEMACFSDIFKRTQIVLLWMVDLEVLAKDLSFVKLKVLTIQGSLVLW